MPGLRALHTGWLLGQETSERLVRDLEGFREVAALLRSLRGLEPRYPGVLPL